MTPLSDPTRREFLLDLARNTAFLPPVVRTYTLAPPTPPLQGKGKGAGRGAAAGKGKAAGKGRGTATAAAAGSLSPTAQGVDAGLQFQAGESATPWSQGAVEPPPWATPPPTTTGN